RTSWPVRTGAPAPGLRNTRPTKLDRRPSISATRLMRMPPLPPSRLLGHRRLQLAALMLTIGLAYQVAWAQRGSGAAQGGPAVRGGGPPRGTGQGPLGGRVIGRGRGVRPTGTALIRGRVTALDTGAP